MKAAFKAVLRVLLLLPLLVFPMRPGALGTGSQTCPTSGRKQLSTTQTKVTWISVQAPSGNTGSIYLGGPAVTTSLGNYITAGGTFFFPAVSNTAAYDLSQSFMACTVTADTVTFTYLQ